jgi:SAM-dependent methyltransferase
VIEKPLDDYGARIEEMAAAFAPGSRSLRIYRDVVGRVDWNEISRIRETYRDQSDKFSVVGGFKYLDLPYWLADKVRVAVALGLADGGPRTVLDVGMGAGHFAAVCQTLGHAVVGTDISVPLYDDICRALRVDRRIEPTRWRKPMRDLGLKFDFVTVIGQLFHIAGRLPNGERLHWSLDDWSYFLNDLVLDHMYFPGEIYIHLNPNRYLDGLRLDETLLAWCQSQGAAVDHKLGKIRFSDVGESRRFDAARSASS